MLDDTEKIRDLLLAKYESLHEIDTQAMETASKAGKPKPPPRPNKPVFLSSKFDGSTPSTSVPTSFGSSSSSSSVPATPAASSVTQSSPSLSHSGLSGSFAAMSISMSPPFQPSFPPPTSLPGYRPLQPIAYNAASPMGQPIITSNVSATAAIFPNGSLPMPYTAQPTYALPPSLPLPSNSMSGSMSGPISGPISGPMPGSQSNYSTPVPSPVPVPAPRPAHTLAPPISAPAALPNGNSKPNTLQGSTSPSLGAQAPSPSSSSVSAIETPKTTQPLKINPQNVLNYMRQDKPPKLLLIDVRRQVQYSNAKIKSQSIVNIEPLALRDG